MSDATYLAVINHDSSLYSFSAGMGEFVIALESWQEALDKRWAKAYGDGDPNCELHIRFQILDFVKSCSEQYGDEDDDRMLEELDKARKYLMDKKSKGKTDE